MSDEEATFIKEYSEENDIEIHVHAPYYINLAGDSEEVEMSFEKIMRAAQMAENIGAKTVIIHPGFYGENSEKKTMKLIIKNVKKVTNMMRKEKYGVKLALETMGKQKVFGTLDEIIEVCKSGKDVLPVIDLAHIHARSDGGLKEPEAIIEIFEKLKPLRLKNYLIHITGVLYEAGNEFYHLPIKKGDMPIAPLVDLIIDNKLNATLISESPLLEHDAVYIRLQVEKAIMKRTNKEEAYYKELSEL
jgi:deoxyribonuclease-4